MGSALGVNQDGAHALSEMPLRPSRTKRAVLPRVRNRVRPSAIVPELSGVADARVAWAQPTTTLIRGLAARVSTRALTAMVGKAHPKPCPRKRANPRARTDYVKLSYRGAPGIVLPVIFSARQSLQCESVHA